MTYMYETLNGGLATCFFGFEIIYRIIIVFETMGETHCILATNWH